MGNRFIQEAQGVFIQKAKDQADEKLAETMTLAMLQSQMAEMFPDPQVPKDLNPQHPQSFESAVAAAWACKKCRIKIGQTEGKGTKGCTKCMGPWFKPQPRSKKGKAKK